MSQTASNLPSLFAVANSFFRQLRYEDAIGIYEFLREQNPDFSPYAFNEMQARQQLAKIAGKRSFKKKYHFNSASECQKRLRIAHLISNLNDPALISVCFNDDQSMPDPQFLLAQANAYVATSHEDWLMKTNQYLAAYKLAPVSLTPLDKGSEQDLFLNLRPARLPVVEGPLVTVCISCFNADPYVEHAVRSILNQSYRNLELFLFNDRSTDSTLNILRRLEREDKRITVIDNPVNQGTYISRNQAFQRANGVFFTIMDADDFALPDRIALQVRHLQENSNDKGVLTDWVRMSADGYFHFKSGWGGGYQHEAVATLMLRTQEVRKRIGYWDSVRFAADTEFLFRMRKVYGGQAVPLLKIPTEISLYHEASLTNHPITGIGVGGVGGLSPVRKTYRDTWLNWHDQDVNKLFVPFPLEKRLFEAPAEMLPTIQSDVKR